MIPIELPRCVVRDWRRGDKAALVRHANNRKVWRNLTHAFPHPYTEGDADAWFVYVTGLRGVSGLPHRAPITAHLR
jgi:hypothetical protein